MTFLQALKTAVGYPLDENYLMRIIIDRGLEPDEPYTGVSDEFMLARADVYMMMATTPNVIMDGFSITVADRDMVAAMAESIYRRYGEGSKANITASRNSIKDSSNIW